MQIVFVPVRAKHVAALATGAYLGQLAVTTYIVKQHNKEILKANAVIDDLTTLARRLAGGLDNFNPGVTQRIFEDLKFEQIIRGVDV